MKVDLSLRLKIIFLIVISFRLCPPVLGQEGIRWEKLPPMPAMDSILNAQGLSGHFVGVHKDVLIVAGGTSFVQGQRPWNGEKRFWNTKIQVLISDKSGSYQWLDSVFDGSFIRAYGASVTIPDGVLCIGGLDSSSYQADVELLSWNPVRRKVERTDFPNIPVSLAYMGATVIDQFVYIVGGERGDQPGLATHAFYRLDLRKRGHGDFKWEPLTPWQGPARMMPVVASQNNGKYSCLFLFSGREGAKGGEQLFFDSYVYDPQEHQWKQLGDIRVEGIERCLSGASSIAVGLNHIMVFSGADSESHRRFRAAQLKYHQTPTGRDKDHFRGILNGIADTHIGFSKEVLAYHTLTDNWVKISEFPEKAPVATQAVWWQDNIVIPSGEIAPALRSPIVWKGRLQAKESSILNVLDYLLILVYFAAILYIGYRYKKNIKTTNDYYKAGGRIPGWASGVAIFGTLLSAITFLTTPAKTYNESWIYFLPTISSLVVAPLVVAYIIPAYFKITVTSAYEYLENRFNSATRLLGSLSFLCFQVAKFGVMLLLPALAISAITGIDVMVCIIVIGLFSTIYGTFGGIEAVVWTEVLQVGVFLLAALLSIAVVVLKLDGGLADIIAVNSDFGKFDFVKWDLSFSEITIFVALSYWIGGGLVPYISDQTVIQKYLVTKDAKSAARGVWINGVLIVLSSVLFFAIGSALFAYYHAFPEKLNPELPTQESIFPWFIVNELPAGIRGIVVAGIFAVAMSTISSTMNSMSAAVVTDLVRFKSVDPNVQLRLAKIISAVFGVIGTLIAVLMFVYEVGSLWDMIRRITGLLTGGLAGLFLLGILTKRAHYVGALTGFVGSAVVQYVISVHTPTHFMVYSFTGMLSCFVIGYLISILLPVPRKLNKQMTN